MTHAMPHLALAWPARRIMQWALLWSLLLSAAEFFVLAPIHQVPLLNFLAWWLSVWSLPAFFLFGCTILVLARHAETSGHWRPLVMGGLALALVWSATQPLWSFAMSSVWNEATGAGFVASQVGYGSMPVELTVPFLALFSYNLWNSLFYGGLLVAGYVLSVRGERTRVLLREAAIARGRTEALLGELQLQTLHAQIDPALLLDALDEVQRLYRQHSERADALLERLVDFLRAAMPGLKDRRSSLQAELRLAEAFARLQALMPGGARWQVEWPRELPERMFPSLLLLPIMALAGAKASPRLVVRLVDAQVSLQVQALGCELPPHVEQRTRTALQAAVGPALRMRVNESTQTQLLIELDPPTVPKEHEHEPRTS